MKNKIIIAILFSASALMAANKVSVVEVPYGLAINSSPESLLMLEKFVKSQSRSKENSLKKKKKNITILRNGTVSIHLANKTPNKKEFKLLLSILSKYSKGIKDSSNAVGIARALESIKRLSE